MWARRSGLTAPPTHPSVRGGTPLCPSGSGVPSGPPALRRAPEMVDLYSKKRIDERVDVWALGVLLYYLCFFTLPFEALKLQILNCKYDIPSTPSYSPPLIALMRALLQPDPDKRPSAVATLQRLCALRGAAPPPAPPPPPPQPNYWQARAGRAPPPAAAAAPAAKPQVSAGLFGMLDWVPDEAPAPAPAPAQPAPLQQDFDLFGNAEPPPPAVPALDAAAPGPDPFAAPGAAAPRPDPFAAPGAAAPRPDPFAADLFPPDLFGGGLPPAAPSPAAAAPFGSSPGGSPGRGASGSPGGSPQRLTRSPQSADSTEQNWGLSCWGRKGSPVAEGGGSGRSRGRSGGRWRTPSSRTTSWRSCPSPSSSASASSRPRRGRRT